MQVVVTWQTIITAAAVVAAVVALFKYYNRGYDFVKRQQNQDRVIQSIQDEQALLTYGILACLKGLQEIGADGPVSEAVAKIEKHLNQAAHKGGGQA